MSDDSIHMIKDIHIYETSAAGLQMEPVHLLANNHPYSVEITIDTSQKYQTILGFGGSFTASSAHVLNKVGADHRKHILEAYFGEEGARYSLTRTHINSCDFSLNQYSYAPIDYDTKLEHFSIQEDKNNIIPMIKDAKKISKEGFRIISSPWTAPPWMKDNKDWCGGSLLKEYYPVWATFFSKYIEAYRSEDIDIWGITVENEPLGNSENWESMHYTPQEMNDFVNNFLGPTLKIQHPDVKILGYDQNRDELKTWVDAMYDDKEAASFYDGVAIHWYASTYHYFPEELQYTHHKAPDKYIIQTEACVDAEVPAWRDDAWYWSEEATDWGYDWASKESKYLHPKYIPTHRYARDIIGCLNNWVNGWVDWNMVLDRRGGPNWAKNWCVAPIIVDADADEVYFTPLYYVMSHFSKFIRPGAIRLGVENEHKNIMVTAVENPDKSIAIVLFNPKANAEIILLKIHNGEFKIAIDQNAIQTIIITNNEQSYNINS